jgi:hypothetical protein
MCTGVTAAGSAFRSRRLDSSSYAIVNVLVKPNVSSKTMLTLVCYHESMMTEKTTKHRKAAKPDYRQFVVTIQALNNDL